MKVFRKISRRSVFPAVFALLAAFVSASALADTLGDMARAAKKPLVADFGMKRCQQCIAQGKIMDELNAEVAGKVLTRFVHIKEEVAVTAEYQVMMVPTIIFFDASGKELYRNVGLMKKDDLMGKLRELGLWGK